MSLLQKLFSSSSDPSGQVLGIDIGSSALKVVELKQADGVVSLSTYGELQLAPYMGKEIGEAVNLSPKQEQQALVDIIRESAVEAKRAVFAMPLSASFVTNVSVPRSTETELSALVRIEARKVIPASLSEVTLDWAEVGSTDEKLKQDGVEVPREILIAAIQNSALERFRVLMQFANLQEPPSEIECFSALRGLRESEGETVAIVDIGATSAKLYIMRDGLLVRMYRIRAGGQLVTKQIAEALSIEFAKAEDIKCSLSRSDTQYETVRKLHDSVYSRPLREFSQVIADYERKNDGLVTAVFLTGGATLFTGFDQLVKEALSRETIMANPFAKVSTPAFMEDVLQQIGPSFTVALGAALRAYE